ncbi:MAG: hypothetical protein R2713_02450 [Ilumatobacteraceae bacterium]
MSARDGIGMILRQFGVAVGKLVHHRGVTVVSTGSAYALPWMLAADHPRFDAVFVESAARLSGLSASGRAIAAARDHSGPPRHRPRVDGWEQWESACSTWRSRRRRRGPTRRGRAACSSPWAARSAHPPDRLRRCDVREVVPSRTLVVQHAHDPVPGDANHATLPVTTPSVAARRRRWWWPTWCSATLDDRLHRQCRSSPFPDGGARRGGRRSPGRTARAAPVGRGVTVVAEVDDLDSMRWRQRCPAWERRMIELFAVRRRH